MSKLEKFQTFIRIAELVILICVLVLTVTLLVGCGDVNSDSVGSVSYDDNVLDGSLDSDQDEIYDANETNGVSSNEEVFLEAFNTSPSIEETVLWDEKDVKVTVTSLDYTNWSAVLNFTIENNTDKTLSFVCGSMSYGWNAVNGYMIADGYLNENIEAGQSADCDISFGTTELSLYGINEIADIQFGIKAEDEDHNSFYLSPKKIETTAASSYDYDTDTYVSALESGLYQRLGNYSVEYIGDDKLYDNNGIAIVSEALLVDETVDDGCDCGVFLELENKSGHNIYAELSDLYINDAPVYGYSFGSEEMIAGTRAVETIDIINLIDRSDDADESLIADGVDSVSFTLSIKNENYEDALSPEVIIIDFK